MAFWQIIEYPVTFEWKGNVYNWIISYQETEHMPHVFQVNENKYFIGQLIYYPREDRWRFFYKNQDNVQELADILGDFVVKGYE